jgi:uridine kinase
VDEVRRRPVVIGIGGTSGSGKTTLAIELARELHGYHFQIDSYYRDLGHLPPVERAQQNFDHPCSIESELLVEHIRQLREGQAIDAPVYDFTSHTRKYGETVRIDTPQVLLVEGNFALHFDALRTLYDWSVFIDVPDSLCYKRRLARDVAQRGRRPEDVRQQFEETVRPMAEAFVRPSAVHAALRVDGAGSIDWIVERVRGALRESPAAKLLLG